MLNNHAELVRASESYAEQMQQTQKSFHENSAARGAVGQNISQLTEQMRSIEASLKNIENISMQVTILATNASIEAARAGVHGKGFAIVAQEVRTLAKNTDVAVAEINTKIEQVNQLLQKTVSDMGAAKAIGDSFNERLGQCVENASQLHQMLLTAEPENLA